MKLSVALCTFNGERYLPEQLASIREQTRLPDELVICDDASTDRTVAIARMFREQAPFEVRIELNTRNVGTTLNFDKAIGLCSGEMVVLADQDDSWFPDKLLTLESTLEKNPEAGFVFSNAEVVDDGLKPLGYTLWEALQFGAAERERFRGGQAFESLMKRYRVTGATMAFRSAYRDIILPIPRDCLHDAWVALMISAVAPCALISRPLIRYRQHGLQQFGGAKRSLYRQLLAAVTRHRETFASLTHWYSSAFERLNKLPDVARGRLELLSQKAAHCRQRMGMRNSGRLRLPFILQELWKGNYHRFSRGWKTAAQDLLLP